MVVAIVCCHFFINELTSAQYVLWSLVEASSLLLLVGLWTPLVGGVLSLLALWSVFSGTDNFWAEIMLAAMSAALAMLGPGAWSFDARLFGRRRLIRER